VSHKISNTEQSTEKTSVRRAVKSAIATLGTGYLDLVSIHSPLTDTQKRLETYTALLELRDSGFVKSARSSKGD
jgi:aryl-alcohol dehydrogenase-like predicted oxidoreductase